MSVAPRTRTLRANQDEYSIVWLRNYVSAGNGLEIVLLSDRYWRAETGSARKYDAHHLEAPIQFRRLAEQVADELRRRILRGELADGSILPKEDELLLQFPVSKPSLREAMRILEAEGLLRVRRGKLGGAVVRRPNAANVAYTVGLVLGSQDVGLADVGSALRQVEPACAALCAQRSDRKKAVVPALRRLHAESVDAVDDLLLVTSASRRFHEALVSHCGNKTMIILAGALELLWSAHETSWSSRVTDGSIVPIEERLAVLEDHRQVIDAIEAGDARLAHDLAAAHLIDAQHYPGSSGVVDPSTLRNWSARPVEPGR